MEQPPALALRCQHGQPLARTAVVDPAVRKEDVPAEEFLVGIRAVPPRFARQVARLGPERYPGSGNRVEVEDRVGGKVAGASDTVDVAPVVDALRAVTERNRQVHAVVADLPLHTGR